jgi:hypothetical protein
MPPIRPQLLAHARRLYEETDMPSGRIAAYLGLEPTTFCRRVRHKWGWIRRRYHLPRTLPQRRGRR